MQTLAAPTRLRTRLARARARQLARRLGAGFTLVELMVVVVLISILAVIAVPGMRGARDDRLAFTYARQIQQIIHRGRARAAGRGGAHLVVARPQGVRGSVLLFEALDGVPATPGPGPNPVSSCKGRPNGVPQWSTVPGWTIALPINDSARIVDGINLDVGGVNLDDNIVATFRLGGLNVAPPIPTVAAFVICVSGGGTTYVGSGSDVGAAINDMLDAAPFTGTIDIEITRQGGLGLHRHVIVTGAAAPRVNSR